MKTVSLLVLTSLFINDVFGDEVKSVSVMEGDSVTLHTDNTQIKTAGDVIVTWTFGSQPSTTIAQINRAANVYDDDLDGRFRDRLQMNNQTGDLTITNIKTQHTGDYNVEIKVGRNITPPKNFKVNSVRNPDSDQLKSVSVKDGDSVTLHTDVFYINKYDVIQWRFQGIRIAKFNKSASEILEDERFRDKLQLDVQTGSLQISHIRTDLSGLYEVEISSSNYTIHQSFTVTVSGEVKPVSVWKGDLVTINTDFPDIKTYDRILWIFGCDDRIAEVNKQNKQFTPDTRFRDRLKLNDQTEDLTITDIRYEDAGDYELKMISSRRTIQRRFRVNVDGGLSPGVVTGIFILISVIILLLIAAAAAAGVVIYYRRKDKTQEVYEGKSVDLKTEVNDIQRVDLIEWRFKPGEPTSKIWEMFIAAMKRVLGLFSLNETLIAKINPANNIFRTYDGDDDLFRDKLKLNDQTGDLNINDIRQKHTGVYTLKITRGGKTTEKRFNVFVKGETKILEVNEGESVDLKTEVTDIQKDDVIEWRFGDKETLIAQINPANNIFRTYDGDYDEFRDKLELNRQTGDLIINDFRDEHAGVYKLKIIRGGKTSYKTISVSVRGERKTLEVNEGKSVDLKTEVTDIQRDDVIEWRFGETLIAKINPANNIFSTYDGDDELFRDKLNLNLQTGDLTINDIKREHGGVYELKIIRDGKTSYKRFSVHVICERKTLEVNEGKSVDLKTEVKDIQRDDVIEWRFKENLIAEINPANNIFSTSDKGLFRDKLTLNHQTGDLTISDIRWKHTGVYKLKIIRDGETSYKTISVFVKCDVETLRVDEWKSVNLKTKVNDIQEVDLIEWRFGDKETLIAQINPANNIFSTYDGDDDLFRKKLNLNPQTGDLKINYIRWEHTGDYKLKIIRGEEISHKRFRVHVRDKMEPFSVYEGESFNLETKLKDMQGYDVIEWRFGETLIAKINPANKLFNTYDDDDLFRGKLKLNDQTGDLTINDIREKHSGVYTLRRITYGVPPYPQRYFVLVKAVGDSEEKRGKDSEKRGKDSEKKTGKDSARKREEDSVRIEMQPLLNKHSQ